MQQLSILDPMDCEVKHSILEKIDRCEWVKACYVNIGSDRVTQLKVPMW